MKAGKFEGPAEMLVAAPVKQESETSWMEAIESRGASPATAQNTLECGQGGRRATGGTVQLEGKG